MGIGGISIWQLLIILAIVILLFGTKRLRNIGQDLGNAVKGFRSAVKDGEKADEGEEETSERLNQDHGEAADAEFEQEEKEKDGR